MIADFWTRSGRFHCKCDKILFCVSSTFQGSRSLSLSELSNLFVDISCFFLSHVSFDMNLIERLRDQLLLELMEFHDELLQQSCKYS